LINLTKKRIKIYNLHISTNINTTYIQSAMSIPRFHSYQSYNTVTVLSSQNS